MGSSAPRRWLVVSTAVIGAAQFWVTGPLPGDAAALTLTISGVTDYALPNSQSGPAGLAVAPDGSVWFSEAAGNRIGHIDANGALREFAVPSPRAMPTGITIGPDGDIWFAEEAGSAIGRLTPEGSFIEFPLPPLSWPAAITAGPDAALWFTENGTNQIGRISTGGVLSAYSTPTSASRPLAIVAGPDGNLWFTEAAVNQIGKISPKGKITEYPSPTDKADGLPMAIAVGSDKRIWFVSSARSIVAMTTDGIGTEYSLPPGSDAVGMTASTSGNLWFSNAKGSIGTLSASGQAAATPLSGAGSIGGIAIDQAGSIWISDITGNKLTRVDVAVGSSAFSLSEIKPSFETVSAHASNASIPLNPLPNALATPYWWSGSCDSNHNPGSHSLGTTFLGMPACGPNNDYRVQFPGGVYENEWECVELSMRYLYLAFAQNAYSANGSQVVQNYPGNVLVRIPNGTAGQAPAVGDILSYGPVSQYGHTSVVTSVDYTSSGNGTITVIEQNASSNGSDSISVVNWVVQNTYGLQITQWLHWPLFNQLTNASFETGSRSPWAAASGPTTAYQVYNTPAGQAMEGSWYMEMNTTGDNGSIYQDVLVPPQVGQSYTFSIWVLSRDGNDFSGTLAIWGLGGTSESGARDFTAGASWTAVSAPLNVNVSGHTKLRAQIYMHSTGRNLDLDGGQLVNAGPTNASFEIGSSSWSTMGLQTITYTVRDTPSGYALEGSRYAEVSTDPIGGSIYQDITIAPQPGQSYTLTVWVRCNCYPWQTVTGSLNLFALGNGNPGSGTTFTAVSWQWTRVSVTVDLPTTSNGHTQLRAQIYVNTALLYLDVDGATLAGGNRR